MNAQTATPHKRHLGERIASPYGMALMSSVVFVIAWVFPPDVYKYLMDEPDLIFLDVPSASFYALCVGAFLLGVWLVDTYVPSEPRVDENIEANIPPAVVIAVPVVLALGLNLLSIIPVLRNGELVPLILSGEGAAVKEATGAEGSTVLSGTCLMGVIWWATWRYQQLQVKGISACFTRFLLYLATMSAALSASLRLGRGELMPIFVGLAVVFLARKMIKHEVTAKFLLKVALLVLLFITIVFVGFAVLRGSDEPEKVAASCVAYTISPYNRLAALLSGTLRYPYAGSGVYLSGFLASNNLFKALRRKL